MQLSRIITVSLAVGTIVAVAVWLSLRPSVDLHARMPGADRRPDAGGDAPAAATWEPKLERFDVVPPDHPGSWPCFRGEARTGIALAEKGLAGGWPAEGPRALWSVELGEGYAGPAVRFGRVFLLDYDRPAQADALRCFSLADGREVWRFSYPVAVKRNHGMSRTVPAVTERHVVALGPKCHVTCLDASTGEFRWQIDLVKDHKTTVPPWYAGQCPLVEGSRVILAPGGEHLLLAADIETGRVEWGSPNPRRWTMTHSSILPVDVEGTRMYVYSGSGGVAGVSAADGQLLWDTDVWKIGIATIATPLDLGEGRLFLSGGYNAGSMFLDVRREGDRYVATPGKRLDPEVFGSTQQTPLFHDGHIYGVRPDGELACLDLEGDVRWTSGPSSRFGLGPYLIADGKILVLDDEGHLAMARATPEGYEEIARARVLQGHEAWAPMAIAGGLLLARDFTRMVCLDLRGDR